MKKILYAISSAALVFTLTCTSSVTAQAHGHHGSGHHSESQANYYYCNGHEAHLHDNGACPYAAQDSTSNYYYCDGHEAHLHDNDICPYASAVPAPDSTESAVNYDSSIHNSDSGSGSGTADNNTTTNTIPRRTYGRQTLRHSCHIVYTP